jgi:hypothetical protein
MSFAMHLLYGTSRKITEWSIKTDNQGNTNIYTWIFPEFNNEMEETDKEMWKDRGLDSYRHVHISERSLGNINSASDQGKIHVSQICLFLSRHTHLNSLTLCIKKRWLEDIPVIIEYLKHCPHIKNLYLDCPPVVQWKETFTYPTLEHLTLLNILFNGGLCPWSLLFTLPLCKKMKTCRLYDGTMAPIPDIYLIESPDPPGDMTHQTKSWSECALFLKNMSPVWIRWFLARSRISECHFLYENRPDNVIKTLSDTPVMNIDKLVIHELDTSNERALEAWIDLISTSRYPQVECIINTRSLDEVANIKRMMWRLYVSKKNLLIHDKVMRKVERMLISSTHLLG